ncbi:uncharacterized protein [Montipora foliosa]|uniref:uncharacterized protein n=1 Tax=Montipora foliosa TaxID=591990 RepID=UPI0035F2151D
MVCKRRCRRHVRLHIRVLWALLCAGGLVLVAYLRQQPSLLPPPLRVKYTKSFGNSTSACRLPNLDPFHFSILEFVKDLGRLQCKGRRFSSLENNVLRVEAEGIVSAQYKKILRPVDDDFEIKFSDPIPVPNLINKSAKEEGFFGRLWSFLTHPADKFLGQVKVDHEFIQVEVATPWGKTRNDVHATIIPKKEALARELKPGGIPLNVALIMFDSTSAANFRRKMPKSLEYLTHNLKSILMRGETIVGDGTTAQLAALLTGIAESEEPEARKDMGKAANPVDYWRWIFRDYKEKGYVTMFSEDSPRQAVFNYRLKGFRHPPTDHYSRPFWIAAEDFRHNYCINSRASHNVSFEYILRYFREYKSTSKFMLVSHDEISHEDSNTIAYADDDFKNLLWRLKEESFLNETFLITFSDHGARFSEVRKTIQGKLEERLPFLSITTPKWFSESYPELYHNLVHNSRVLTTPFDVYATLRHILTYPEYPSGIKTGQSLFSRVDAENRTCAEAGVEDHWCPCLNLEEISVNEPVVEELSEFVVNHINHELSKNPEVAKLCHKLDLVEVKNVFRDMPSGTMQFFKQSKRDQTCDNCGLEFGEKSRNTLVKDTLYQLQIVTSPNNGFYEASIRLEKGIPSLVGDISRLDAYNSQINCIREKYPMIRKYCYCY